MYVKLKEIYIMLKESLRPFPKSADEVQLVLNQHGV